ncbi:MAG: hypothetical protein IJ842_04115 [Bacilli bacterium]|nr:hypothetical protein [Bacilli bacterium]
MKKKNKKNKKHLYTVIVVILFIIIGLLVIGNGIMLSTLKSEVKDVKEKNIITDKYDKNSYLLFGYGTILKTIKEYYYDNASLIQEIIDIRNDPFLSKVLSYDNYSSDGTDFNKTISFLTEKKKKCDENFLALTERYSNEYIENLLSKKVKKTYYKDLYKELMLKDSDLKEYEDTRNYINGLKTEIDNIFDVSTKVINFLIENKESWELQEGQIKFKSRELFNTYNEMISLINKKEE